MAWSEQISAKVPKKLTHPYACIAAAKQQEHKKLNTSKFSFKELMLISFSFGKGKDIKVK